jgi:hypothetical protein
MLLWADELAVDGTNLPLSANVKTASLCPTKMIERAVAVLRDGMV